MTETSINAEDQVDKPEPTIEEALAVAVSDLLVDAQHAEDCDLIVAPREGCPPCTCLIGRLYEAIEPGDKAVRS